MQEEVQDSMASKVNHAQNNIEETQRQKDKTKFKCSADNIGLQIQSKYHTLYAKLFGYETCLWLIKKIKHQFYSFLLKQCQNASKSSRLQVDKCRSDDQFITISEKGQCNQTVSDSTIYECLDPLTVLESGIFEKHQLWLLEEMEELKTTNYSNPKQIILSDFALSQHFTLQQNSTLSELQQKLSQVQKVIKSKQYLANLNLTIIEAFERTQGLELTQGSELDQGLELTQNSELTQDSALIPVQDAEYVKHNILDDSLEQQRHANDIYKSIMHSNQLRQIRKVNHKIASKYINQSLNKNKGPKNQPIKNSTMNFLEKQKQIDELEYQDLSSDMVTSFNVCLDCLRINQRKYNVNLISNDCKQSKSCQTEEGDMNLQKSNTKTQQNNRKAGTQDKQNSGAIASGTKSSTVSLQCSSSELFQQSQEQLPQHLQREQVQIEGQQYEKIIVNARLSKQFQEECSIQEVVAHKDYDQHQYGQKLLQFIIKEKQLNKKLQSAMQQLQQTKHQLEHKQRQLQQNKRQFLAIKICSEKQSITKLRQLRVKEIRDKIQYEGMKRQLGLQKERNGLNLFIEKQNISSNANQSICAFNQQNNAVKSKIKEIKTIHDEKKQKMKETKQKNSHQGGQIMSNQIKND